MTTTLTLDAELRERVGTTEAQRLRAAGKIPAVVYGHGAPAQHVALDARRFEELLTRIGRNAIIALTIDGKKETALVRDLRQHEVSRKILHVDLLRVSAKEHIHAKAPVVTTGVARGVKEFGGVMDVVVHELEIEGPADEFPDHIEVDVSDLGLHQHIVAGDVKVPKGFKIRTPADTIVVSIEASKTSQQLEEVPAAPVQAEPEVIGQKAETTE